MESNSQSVQQKRVSPEEISLLKATFKDREDLLLAVRNLFFGFTLGESERQLIQTTFNTEAIRKLMRKIFLPELGKDMPLGQSIDLWMTVKLEDNVYSTVRGRQKLIQALEQVLKLLENPDGTKLDLRVNTDELNIAELEPDLISRNTFITHVELQLQVIRKLANEQEETSEQRQKRFKKNSSQ